VAGRKLRDLDHDARAQPGTQVGWADEHVSQVVVVHEVIPFGLHDVLDGVAPRDEALEDFLDVGSHLHRNQSRVVLLVDPHEEVLLVVEEDTTPIGPVPAHTAGEQERGIGFLEQEVFLPQRFFFFVRDSVRFGFVRFGARQWVVVALQIALQRQERFHHHPFQLPSVLL